MHIEIEVKDGLNRIAHVKGRREDTFSDTDTEQIIATEQLLERLTGYRFHISFAEN